MKRKACITLVVIWNLILLKPVNTYAGQYYVTFDNIDEDTCYVTAGKVLDSEEFDEDYPGLLNNLSFPENDFSYYFVFETDGDKEDVIETIREYMLYNGYAKLIKHSLAEDYEIAAENYACRHWRGIWSNSDIDDYDTTSLSPPSPQPTDYLGRDISTVAPDYLYPGSEGQITIPPDDEMRFSLKKYIRENAMALLGIFASVTGGGIFTGGCIRIYKKVSTRKRKIVIIGASATGKTTLSRVLKETLTNRDFSNQIITSSTPSLSCETFMLSYNNQKTLFETELIVPPGDDLSVVMDCVIDKSKVPYIIILVLAATKDNSGNGIDAFYIREQRILIKYLGSLISPEKMKKPLAFLIFINKRDLLPEKHDDEIEEIFNGHIRTLKKLCQDNKIKFYIVTGSVLNKAGIFNVLDIIKKNKKELRKL